MFTMPPHAHLWVLLNWNIKTLFGTRGGWRSCRVGSDLER
jgi:hypothetical protein